MESLTQVKVKHRVFEDAVHLTIPPGASIREIIDQAQIPEAAMPNIVVLNHGSVVGDWEYITKDADNLAICVVPQGGRGGGKGILGAIAMIAVAAFAWWAAPFVAGAIGFGGSALATSIIGAGITMIGGMAMNALIKPPALDIGSFSGQGGFGGGGMRGAQTVDNRPQSIADAAEASTYSFGGQSNQARKYSPAIKVYGRHRVFPAIAVNPFIENAGTESKITTIYDFGMGTVTLEDLRIGDADIGTYSPQIETYSGSLMKTTRLYPKRVAYESLSFIPKLDQEIILRTKPQTQSAEVDLYFPRGLVFYDDRGNRTENKVQIEVWWRAVGATTWNKVRDDQFSGASVRQDIAISGRTEVYDPGLVGVNQYDQYNRYVNRTYWLITHYPYTDQPGSGYHSEVTVFFDGAMVYSGPEASVGGSFGEYSIGPKQEEADYLPRAKEYYFAVTRRTTHVTGGTVWKDYQHNKPGVTVYGTQIFIDNQEVYHGPQLMSGIIGDYLKGNYKEDRNPSPILKEALYSIMKPTYSGLTTSTVVGSTSQPFTLVAAVDFVNPGLYEFKIVRKSSNSVDNRNANDITLTLIKSFQAGEIFKLDKKHTMVEMRLVANDKINGVVSNFSAIATSILPVWDGTKWTEKITRNPAWIAYDILTGEANPAALKPEQIDLASFYKLAQLCDEQVTTTVGGVTTTGNRYESDFVVDYETTVYQLLESVLSVCRATLIITQSGKYGVLIDQAQTTPRQLFTPANSRNFSGNRTFSDRPHALRVKYVEPNMGWQMNEVIVYDDGRDVSNATKFEDLSTFGITNGARAWRYGRYMMAQGLHRSEQFTIELDVENLAVQRGDLVKVAHDVPKIGGVGARIIDITGNDVHVTEGVQVVVSNYTVRLSDGTVRSGAITGSPADDVFTFDDVTGLQTDDLVVFGATSRVTQDYLVQEIMPGGDLTATLTLVRYVPEIYTADQGLIPPWDSGLTDTIINKTDLKIVNLSGTATLVYPDRLPFSEVKLDWAYEGKNYDHANVFLVRPGYQDLFLGDTKYVDFEHLIDTLKETEKLGLMKFHVIPYNTKGLEGTGAYISVQVDPDVAPPQTPYGFAVNVQKETVNLFWQMNQEEDVDNYIIRYTPEVNAPNWNASMFLARLSWISTTFSVGARTGTYMIRAVDTSGNQSAISKQRTTVATLPDLNVIDTVDDSLLGWTGQNYQTQIRGGALIASGPANAVEPTGFYVVSKTIDLGEVYEARISSKIRAYGESNLDFMSQWTTLASVPALTRVQSDQWDAWVEVRSTGRMSFMSDWTSLDTVNPMSGGSATWADWRPVHVGDFTGHLFQFRIQLRSFTPDVRPVVTSGLIEIDMVDRIDYYGDVVIPTAGARVTFDPEFRNVPAVAVTIDGNTDPVVATITNKTSGGVSIALYNTQTHAAVAGKVDVHAQGYGRRGIASI
jgi:Putative phage tail protein